MTVNYKEIFLWNRPMDERPGRKISQDSAIKIIDNRRAKAKGKTCQIYLSSGQHLR